MIKLPIRTDPELQETLLRAIAKRRDGCAISEELRPEVETAMGLSVATEQYKAWTNEISFCLMDMRRKKKWLSSPFFDYDSDISGPTAGDREWILTNRPGFDPNQRVWRLTEAGQEKLAQLGVTIAWLVRQLKDIEREEENTGGVGLNAEDEVKRTLRSIVLRRGQSQFRMKLIETYGRCVISGCNAESALEAAHIRPCASGGTNDLSNGLLLRADLHTLFDLRLILIDPETVTVRLAPSLTGTSYNEFDGMPLRFPSGVEIILDKDALKDRWPTNL